VCVIRGLKKYALLQESPGFRWYKWLICANPVSSTAGFLQSCKVAADLGTLKQGQNKGRLTGIEGQQIGSSKGVGHVAQVLVAATALRHSMS
jgi:hypothetical protein